MCRMMIFCVSGTSMNVKIVTLYQRELFKKIPRLGTFCTQ